MVHTPPFDKTPPTSEGWFWHRAGPGRKASIYEVVQTSTGLSVYLRGLRPTPVAEIGGEWSGPLVPPE